MTELYFRKVNDAPSSGGFPPSYRLWKVVGEQSAGDGWLMDMTKWIGKPVSEQEMGELARKAGRVTVEW